MATIKGFEELTFQALALCESGANAQNVSFKTLYDGHFTLSTHLIKLITTLSYSSTNAAPKLFRNLPLFLKPFCSWPYLVCLCHHTIILQQILKRYLKLWELWFPLLPNTQSSTHVVFSVFFLSHMLCFCQQPVTYMYKNKVMIIKLFFFKVGVNKSSMIYSSGNRMLVDIR